MIAAVAVAGGLGTAVRLMVDGSVRSLLGDRLPWGTLAINIVGSFALGALMGTTPTAQTAAIVGTGLLGGFTTFSTASFEAAVLALERRRLAALAYTLGTALLCVGAAAAGYAITD